MSQRALTAEDKQRLNQLKWRGVPGSREVEWPVRLWTVCRRKLVKQPGGRSQSQTAEDHTESGAMGQMNERDERIKIKTKKGKTKTTNSLKQDKILNMNETGNVNGLVEAHRKANRQKTRGEYKEDIMRRASDNSCGEGEDDNDQ
ncbi:hypothetical protein QQF64_034408 [Cirrhinus molitorella]|uniref:Uncharacterized protein n=1 Tax=Cirrhinus molitorella TaxID=172907 RepID=A0ABR3L3H1_9TELE